jgi:hypothetical protein
MTVPRDHPAPGSGPFLPQLKRSGELSSNEQPDLASDIADGSTG